MTRAVTDRRLDSRAARAGLRVTGKPYYRDLDRGLHLGYRKGKMGGRWVMRRYAGDGKYILETIGTADDRLDADGFTVLDFRQAQERARALFAQHGRVVSRGEAIVGPLTVRDCVEAYLAWLQIHRKSAYDASNRAALYIFPELGGLEVSKLTAPLLRRWHEALAAAPRRIKAAANAPPRFAPAPATPEERRRRKSSANRTLTILKAALSRAFQDHKIGTDLAWRSVKPFKAVESARVRYLTKDEIARLVDACPPDFRDVVNAGLFTGMRYGELGALKVADFNPDVGTVTVRESKGGRPRHVVLTPKGQRFFADLVAGRPSDAPMLLRANGSAWLKSHQRIPMLEACRRAGITPAVGIHTLRHTVASHMAMAGIPLQIVAQYLGHIDTRMVERHYSHLSTSYVASTIRKLAPELGILR